MIPPENTTFCGKKNHRKSSSEPTCKTCTGIASVRSGRGYTRAGYSRTREDEITEEVLDYAGLKLANEEKA